VREKILLADKCQMVGVLVLIYFEGKLLLADKPNEQGA
jgi:hypothetical protein